MKTNTNQKKKKKSVLKSRHLPETTFQIELEGCMGVSHTEKKDRNDGRWREVYMVRTEGPEGTEAWRNDAAQHLSLTTDNLPGFQVKKKIRPN